VCRKSGNALFEEFGYKLKGVGERKFLGGDLQMCDGTRGISYMRSKTYIMKMLSQY